MIQTKTEKARGCGFRKPGGIYLVSDGGSSPCCKLPFELKLQHGITQFRGFRWIDSNIFLEQDCVKTKFCPMNMEDVQVGLMWVGEVFYKSSSDFMDEAKKMGISKRISQIPTDFEVGKHWIYLAHPKAIGNYKTGKESPGIFTAFKPKRIEYIVTGQESEEKIAELELQGFTCIQIIKDLNPIA